VTQDRPFYELDDDELIFEEATEAALSDAAPPAAAPALISPALTLLAPLDASQARMLLERFGPKERLTLLDHAYILNRLACRVTLDGQDTFGFAQSLAAESLLLLLDAAHGRQSPRSAEAAFPHDAIAAFTNAALDYRGLLPSGLAARYDRVALTQLAISVAHSTPFFAFRRLALALAPSMSGAEALTEALAEYTACARVLVNGAAAREAILPWKSLAQLTDAHAESAARAVLELLESGVRRE
jgi:hypothetical protein